ncbi:glutathione S-transferase family protein [Oleiagrimonas soli]|uniref:Glutathione S-transferase n=1 Tax=Oleiagrimonas soli TaxID=1543381 RepID=A0A099D1G7_9GAMM|nr:glutathione S-transferase [Oleiagrimonas soli]MBB6184817.1 glutathione S-transferase [Oleiagrimonas soli]
MSPTPYVTFFHAPHSRSGGTRALFEELGVDYDMHVLNFKTGTQRDPEYLAINPMGKVPAIRHGEALITEQPAVMMYLADLYPEKGLAPSLTDPLRGPYLRWMVFYGSCFEPAVVDRSMKREPAAKSTSPYGGFEDVMALVRAQVDQGEWWLGDRFTAADVLWGTALNWTVGFGLVPETPAMRAYIDRVMARPAMARAAQKDKALAASQEG